MAVLFETPLQKATKGTKNRKTDVLASLKNSIVRLDPFDGLRFLDRDEETEYCSRTLASTSAFAEGSSRSRTGGREAPLLF